MQLLLVRAEQSDAGREPMQEVLGAHRSDLTLSEKSGDRNWPQRPLSYRDIVVGLAEQVRAAAIAGEQQSRRWGWCLMTGLFQQELQITVSGPGIAQMELHGLTWPEIIADDQCGSLAVERKDIPDQEIARFELLLILAHDTPQMQTPLQHLFFVIRQRLEDPLQLSHRWLASQFEHDVPFGSRDNHRIANRPTALGNNRSDIQRSAHSQGNGTVVKRAIVQHQAVFARGRPAAGHPSHHQGAGTVFTPTLQQNISGEGEGIGQQDQRRVLRELAVKAGECHPFRRLLQTQMGRLQFGRGAPGCPQRPGRIVFDLLAPSRRVGPDHPLAQAADLLAGSEELMELLIHGSPVSAVVVSREADQQVGGRLTGPSLQFQLLAELRDHWTWIGLKGQRGGKSCPGDIRHEGLIPE